MPVHKCAVWIWLPRPYVKRVEGRQAETIGTLEIMEELPHELGCSLPGMGLVPLIGQYQKISPDQSQTTIWLGFVDHDLRLCGINYAAAHQRHIHVVKPHCT